MVFTCTVTVFHKKDTSDRLGSCDLRGRRVFGGFAKGSDRKKRNSEMIPSPSFDIKISSEINIPGIFHDGKITSSKPNKIRNNSVSLFLVLKYGAW